MFHRHHHFVWGFLTSLGTSLRWLYTRTVVKTPSRQISESPQRDPSSCSRVRSDIAWNDEWEHSTTIGYVVRSKTDRDVR